VSANRTPPPYSDASPPRKRSKTTSSTKSTNIDSNSSIGSNSAHQKQATKPIEHEMFGDMTENNSANGVANGSSDLSNGKMDDATYLDERLHKKEFIRIILQSLDEMGYK
jgi:hypothetical protein